MTLPRGLPAKLLREVRSIVNLAWLEFQNSVLHLRFLISTSIVGFLILLFAWRLGLVAAESPPAAFPLWNLGADGALAAHAYGFVPLLLPVIPLVLAYHATKRHEASGFWENLMSRSVPRYVSAFGLFMGLFLVTSVVGLVLGGLSILLINASVGVSVSGGFAAAFLGGCVLLGGLYLGTALVLMRFGTPGQFGWIALLVWAFANGVRNLGFIVSGQFLLIVPIRGPAAYTASFADWLSFTGVYQGMMAPYVPVALGFVTQPSILDLGGTFAFSSISVSGWVWMGFLLLLYLALVLRRPLVR